MSYSWHFSMFWKWARLFIIPIIQNWCYFTANPKKRDVHSIISFYFQKDVWYLQQLTTLNLENYQIFMKTDF